MIKKSILFGFLMLPFLLPAQDEATEYIRRHYQEVQEKIKSAREAGPEGSFYLNEIKENVHGASWRATGQYEKSIRFWYDDQPGYACEEFGGDEACHLQFIEKEDHTDIGKSLLEFCFDSGVLIFMYAKREGWERRFYWKDGELIRAQLDKEVLETLDADTREEAMDFWKEAAFLRKMFMELFQ